MFASTSCPRAFAPAVCLFATLGLASPLLAATDTYTDQAAFLNQVQPGYYLEDFASLPSGDLGVSSRNFAGNGFAYTASVLDTSLFGGDVGSRNLSTNNSAVGNILSLTFTSGNVYAVGGNFFYDANSNGPANVDILLMLNDGTLLPLPAATTTTFGGFVSDTPIISLSFDAGGSDRFPAMDNIVVGGIPEPTSLGLLGSVAAMALRRRRR